MLLGALVAGFAPRGSGRDEFRFEKLDARTNDQAVARVSAYLDQRFPRGSDLAPLIETLRRAGARCEEMQDPACIYCTYQYNNWIVVMVEWKLLVYFDETKTKIARIQVNRGLTGF